MPKQRVLITVKTYPTLSGKYLELSCTAGFREDGSWIRLYPVPFRLLEENKQYKKYQWIEADIIKNKGDPRPESFKVINTAGIVLLDTVATGTKRDWAERRKLVLEKSKIYTSRAEIVDLAHSDKLSLATFKPESITDFVVEKTEAGWPAAKLEKVLSSLKQASLFKDGQDLSEFKVMPKMPYRFSYRFKDSDGKSITLMIEDWEIGQLYFNCVKKHGEEAAVEKVREKYLNDFAKTKDLHLFLGTTYEWHVRRAPNPYVIIGTFHPPFDTQGNLFY